MKRISSLDKETIYQLALASLLAAFCLWQLAHLGGFQWGVDEGMYLMRVFLMQQGYRLYSDIWTDQLPGLIALIQLAFAVFGNSVAVGRAVIVLLATLGLLGTALLAYKLGGAAGSLVSVVMLALAPNFFWLSRAIISPDLPAISLATLSLALAWHWRRTRHRRWLLLSGVTFALGLLVKATAILVLLPLGLVILLAYWRKLEIGRWTLDVGNWKLDVGNWSLVIGHWSLSVALPILIGLSFYDWRAMYNQVVGTQLQSGQVYDPKVIPHARKIGQYLMADNYGLLALGLYGIIPGLRKRRQETLIVLAWLFVTLFALLIRSPMWPEHHLVVLLFPLAILAGAAVQQIWDHLRQIFARTRSSAISHWSLAIGLFTLGVYLASLPRILRADKDLLAAPTYNSQELAVGYLEEATALDDFIITDYPILPFRADRRVPPSLCTVSAKRIKIGLLTDEEMISVAQEYKPTAIVSWIDRLPRLPGFMAWMREHYYLAWSYGTDHRIYLLFDPSSIQNPQAANLDHKVKFLGYTIDNWAVEAGGTLRLTLYWQTQQQMERIYKVFTHLLDREGSMWGQKDEIAWGWFHPTTDWLPGELIVQEFEIPVSADAPPGEYAIEIGMYDREANERLPVFDEAGNRLPWDRILLSKKPAVRWEANFTIPANIQHPMQSHLGDKVSFLGYDLLENEIKAGGTLRLTLYWQAQSRMSTSYKVFTHLLDADEHIWGQQDNVPGQGRYPTTGWLEGEVIVDEYEIAVQPDAPPGEYILEIGMYDAAAPLTTLQRLPVFDQKGERVPEDRILLEEVRIM